MAREAKWTQSEQRTLIAADPHEIIGVSLGENHVDFIYLGIFPRSLDRAIEDWTRGHVSKAMLQDKKWDESKRWRDSYSMEKVQGSEQRTRRMHAMSYRSLLVWQNDHVRRRIPRASKGIERRRRKERTDQKRVTKGRRTWIEHTTRLQTDAPRWKKGKRRAKKTRRLQSTNTHAREATV